MDNKKILHPLAPYTHPVSKDGKKWTAYTWDKPIIDRFSGCLTAISIVFIDYFERKRLKGLILLARLGGFGPKTGGLIIRSFL